MFFPVVILPDMVVAKPDALGTEHITEPATKLWTLSAWTVWAKANQALNLKRHLVVPALEEAITAIAVTQMMQRY